MKTLTKTLIAFLIAGMTFTACKKDEDDNGNGAGTLKATVDGTAWTASMAVVANNNSGLITITGSDSGAKQLQLIVHNVTASGTFNLGGSMTNQSHGRWTAGIASSQSYTNMMGQGSGTVDFTEVSDTGAKGTFAFTAQNSEGETVNITNGTFNVTFQ